MLNTNTELRICSAEFDPVISANIEWFKSLNVDRSLSFVLIFTLALVGTK